MTYKEFKTMSSKAIAEAIFNYNDENRWYEYVTALRGPDLDDDLFPFKMLLTAFLRGYDPVIYDVSDWERKVWSPSYFHAPTLVPLVHEKGYGHYLSHAMAGLEALQTVMDSQIPAALSAIVQALEEGDAEEVSKGLEGIRELLKEEA